MRVIGINEAALKKTGSEVPERGTGLFTVFEAFFHGPLAELDL